MAKSLKPIPKNPKEISQETISPYLTDLGKPISTTNFDRNRGTDFSMKNDTVKDISVGLKDIDNAILYYFNNVIKPNVIQNNERLAVPVIYGSPERWKSVQLDGYYRDNNGKLMVPLIMFKRENIEKNRTLGNKLDGNRVHNYQVVGSKYNSRNAYDRFSIINNRIPSEQYYISAIPDYVNITYNCIIFTDYVEQNNKIVEAVNFASDSYWGDPNRWRFKAKIDSFATTTVLELGQDRAAKTTFTIVLNGYIIPDTINKDLATARSKFYTKSQIIFDLEVVDTAGSTTNIDSLRFANKPTAPNTLAATSFIGGGNNIFNIISGSSSSSSGSVLNDDIIYLDVNITAQATIITSPNVAEFVGYNILQPSSGSSLPATTTDDFVFYINGQYIPSPMVLLSESSTSVTAIFNETLLGYTIDSTDEVIAVGKFVRVGGAFSSGFSSGFY